MREMKRERRERVKREMEVRLGSKVSERGQGKGKEGEKEGLRK